MNTAMNSSIRYKVIKLLMSVAEPGSKLQLVREVLPGARDLHQNEDADKNANGSDHNNTR